MSGSQLDSPYLSKGNVGSSVKPVPQGRPSRRIDAINLSPEVANKGNTGSVINQMPVGRPSRMIGAIGGSPTASNRGSRMNTEQSPSKTAHKVDLNNIKRASDAIIGKIDEHLSKNHLTNE